LKKWGEHDPSKRSQMHIFTYEQDAKRCHRYRIKAEGSMVGIIYIPKDTKPIPEKRVLEDKEA